MAQKIPTREFEYYRQTMILGGLRYGISLRWNPVCETWSYGIDINGELVEGYFALVEGQIVANASNCLPWSFGGLYLERINNNTTGIEGLNSGSLCLWFFHSYEIYLMFGSTRI